MRSAPALALAARLALGVALFGPASAGAHINLVSPPSRYGSFEQKFGPCGRAGGTRSANVTTYGVGATVTVVFDELISHPGHYRIAFDPAGDDDLANPDPAAGWSTPAGTLVLADFIPDTLGSNRREVQVALPPAPCDTCTLQVIQVMTDKPPYGNGDDIYYQCADLVLTTGTPPPPPAPPPPSPSPSPGVGATTEGGGGCGSGPGGAAAVLLGAAALSGARLRPRP